VVSDTRVRHALGETGYHTRQQECKDAVAALAKAGEKVKMLRDATPEMLERPRKAFKPEVYRRARHVVSENARVLEAAKALKEGDVKRLGKLVSQSHTSLRDDFEVSCKELDAMVEAAEGLEGHYGTRMVGGGFGGCTVSVVERWAAHEFTRAIAEAYRAATGLEAITRTVVPGRGAGLLGLAQDGRNA
jgi:galactokinase